MVGRKRKPDAIVSRINGDLSDLVDSDDPTVNNQVARSMQTMAASLLQELPILSYFSVVKKVVQAVHDTSDTNKEHSLRKRGIEDTAAMSCLERTGARARYRIKKGKEEQLEARLQVIEEKYKKNIDEPEMEPVRTYIIRTRPSYFGEGRRSYDNCNPIILDLERNKVIKKRKKRGRIIHYILKNEDNLRKKIDVFLDTHYTKDGERIESKREEKSTPAAPRRVRKYGELVTAIDIIRRTTFDTQTFREFDKTGLGRFILVVDVNGDAIRSGYDRIKAEKFISLYRE